MTTTDSATLIDTAREIKTLLGYDPDEAKGNTHISTVNSEWGRGIVLDLACARRLLALAMKGTDA